MDKKIEQIKKTIESKESERDNLLRNGTHDLNEAQNKLSALQAKREASDNTEEYISLTREITDTEAGIEFLNRKLQQIKSGLIEKSELKTINDSIEAEMVVLQDKTFSEFNAELMKLVSMMDKYADEAEELDKLKERAGILAYPSTSFISSHWTSSEISVRYPSALGYWEAFWKAYFMRRNIIARVKDDPEGVLRNNGRFHSYSPEELAIAKALIEEKNS